MRARELGGVDKRGGDGVDSFVDGVIASHRETVCELDSECDNESE